MVVVDDYICCKWSMPYFTKANGNELWVLLAEKAWAKIHGSYHKTHWGYACETMRDLTGAPSKDYEIAKFPDMFERLVKADEKNYMIAAACINEEDGLEESKANELGLVAAHAYSVLRAIEVELEGETHQLIQLRNPWGNTEWTGKWSDSSDIWTPELKEQLNFTEEDDGTFWMDFEDTKRYFDLMYICKVNDDYLYSFFECSDPIDHYLMIVIDKPGEYTFSIT